LEVTTPKDDGFHLMDFAITSVSNDQIEEAFEIILSIQKLREEILFSPIDSKTIEKSISTILNQNRNLLFPYSKSNEDLIVMQKEGKIISNSGLPKNSFCDTNPPNWLMPSFSKRVKHEILLANKKDIHLILTEMNNLLK
jgi:hypothetical protein